MRAVDATFPIDLLKDDPEARAKALALDAAGEAIAISAPALVEVLVGAHFLGGSLLRKTLDLVAEFEVLPADAAVSHEAGRLGGLMRRRGDAAAAPDLLVAATSTLHGLVLVTRDEGFSRVPGLAVERY